MIWRWLWREWRTPSLLIVWLSLTLAVACVLALGSISDRLERGMNMQGREYLAADRVLRSSNPVPAAWLTEARQLGLKVSQQLSFMTMVYAGQKPQLVSAKAVDSAYPLYGDLVTQPPGLKPEPGQILVASKLLSLLDAKIGQTIEVGDSDLQIIGELVNEPDAGFNPFQIAPRVLVNLQDLDKIGAIQPGSRLTHRDMFAGDPQALASFTAFLQPQLTLDQRWFGTEESGTSVGKTLMRAKNFLLLSALLTLLLAITSIAVAMGHYCRSRYELVAVLKTLGANGKAMRRLIIGQWGMIVLLAAAAGGGLGKLFEWAMLSILIPVLPTKLPAASFWPWVWALSSLFLIALLVGLRPYRQLLATPPLRVFRQDAIRNVWPLGWYLLVVGVILLVLLAAMVGFNPLWWTILFGILVLALFLGLFGWLTLWLLGRIRRSPLPLRLALSRLLHQRWVTTTQLAAFSFSFMLLALLLVLRGDLLQRWQNQLPPESPNYFLLNIAETEVAGVKQFLAEHKLAAGQFFPVVRARLTEINSQRARDYVAEDTAGVEALNRELNLTWQEETPEYSPLTAGHWPPAHNEVSMAEKLAEQIGIKLGDSLTFMGDSQTFTVKVSSFRQVDWESLRPNFYFIFSPQGLAGQPQSWMTSFRYQGNDQLLTELNRQFPTLTLLDIRAVIGQISQILQQVSGALELMVILVVICGFLLLLAQIQVGMQQRRQELIVYRILGASKRILGRTLWAEFALLGAVAGFAATLGAEVALGLLQRRLFDLPWQPNYALWVLLPLASILLLSLCGGWLGGRLLRGKALFRHYAD